MVALAIGLKVQTDHTAAAVQLSTDGTLKVQSIEFRACKDVAGTSNSGVIYIGTATMNITSGVGVYKQMKAGEIWKLEDLTGQNSMRPYELYIQSASDNDGVFATGTQS